MELHEFSFEITIEPYSIVDSKQQTIGAARNEEYDELKMSRIDHLRRFVLRKEMKSLKTYQDRE